MDNTDRCMCALVVAVIIAGACLLAWPYAQPIEESLGWLWVTMVVAWCDLFGA